MNEGYVFLVCNCVACNAPIVANPMKCPSIRVGGERQPICKNCFNRWNQIHRISKGLPPEILNPDAYAPCPEHELAVN